MNMSLSINVRQRVSTLQKPVGNGWIAGKWQYRKFLKYMRGETEDAGTSMNAVIMCLNMICRVV